MKIAMMFVLSAFLMIFVPFLYGTWLLGSVFLITEFGHPVIGMSSIVIGAFGLIWCIVK